MLTNWLNDLMLLHLCQKKIDKIVIHKMSNSFIVGKDSGKKPYSFLKVLHY